MSRKAAAERWAAKATAAAKAANAAKPVKVKAITPSDIVGPTEQQMARASFELVDTVRKNEGKSIIIGKAYRRQRMLETLSMMGMFSNAECKALFNYRHAADQVERSLTKDSLNIVVVGSTDGDCTFTARASAVDLTADCERAAGSLARILRAVIVEDLSVSEWAMRVGGSVERPRSKGKGVVIEPKRKAFDIAKLDIKMAAQRVQAELSA
jgi:hypothetical protein